MHLAPEGEIEDRRNGGSSDPNEKPSVVFTMITYCLRSTSALRPLRDIVNYPSALADLTTSLSNFDADEIDYFGGDTKYQRLGDYLKGLR